MVDAFAALGLLPDLVVRPQGAEFRAFDAQLADQRGEPLIVGTPGGLQAQLGGDGFGVGRPIGEERTGFRVEEELAGPVAGTEVVGEAEHGDAERVRGHDDHPVVHDDRGCVAHALQQMPHAAADGLPAPAGGAVRPRQVVQVGVLRGIQAQRPADRVEHRVGHLPAASLFQADVVVGADPGQLRDLFAAQAGDAAPAVAGETDVLRAETSAPRPEKVAELGIHPSSLGAIPAADVVLPGLC
ncbi:hypothetical protein Psi02_74800 [Planotetraspora silvatica]|uniref:Uncharacterized protein n=1 Tax=Planotetraspora silvatica TaxID=234614 RepID=A0A8J3UUP3_9ACTN|nr:hypothetical protein Psi02_74800 [Planotetraspora silvatica]